MRADYMMMYSYNRERSLFITHAYGLSTEVWQCPEIFTYSTFFAVTFQNLLSPIIIHNILFPSFDFYDADVFVWCMDYAAICMCIKSKPL